MVAATVGLVVIWTRKNKSREKTRGNVRNTWARERRGYQDEEYLYISLDSMMESGVSSEKT